METQVFDRITIEPGKMNGQPCIRGLRLTVRRVLELIGQYRSREELRADYPDLEDEDIRQATAYAAAMLGDEVHAPEEVGERVHAALQALARLEDELAEDAEEAQRMRREEGRQALRFRRVADGGREYEHQRRGQHRQQELQRRDVRRDPACSRAILGHTAHPYGAEAELDHHGQERGDAGDELHLPVCRRRDGASDVGEGDKADDLAEQLPRSHGR